MIPPMHAEMPKTGFERLVDIVTVSGQLDPNIPVMQCEPHMPQANDPGCLWAEPPRRTPWAQFKAWARAQWDFLLELGSDGD